jgi:uncharacterized phage protein gp47/JayE
VFNTPNLRINPKVIDVPGSDMNVNLGAMAVMLEEATSRGAACMRGLFVDTAVDDQLARLAYDRYQLTANPAEPSTVDLVLTRPLPSAATPGTFIAGSRVQTPNGLQFATDLAVTVDSFDVTATIPATCLTAGAETKTAAGTITQFADSPFDSNWSVTNPRGAAGGTDAETNVQFRGRIRAFFPTVRRGVMGAIEYGAVQVPGVAVARAAEALNPYGMPAAFVELVVADRDGDWSSTMLRNVRNMLLTFRSCGIPVLVIGGSPTYQPVVWSASYRAGVDEVEAQNRLRMVTVAMAQFLPPGPDRGVLYRSSLIAAGKTVPGVVLSDDSLRFPLGDVVPETTQQMIRIRPQDVTFA